jgi:hypothetical protein
MSTSLKSPNGLKD